MTQYRHGGGVAGNVPAGKIRILRSAIPYIDRVTNLRRAEGGRDQESLEEAKMRAAHELRAQHRAVTAEDYENLAQGASRSVARVKCITPGEGPKAPPPGTVDLLIVPAAHDALRARDLSKLYVDQETVKQLVSHLDRYRLLTTTLRVKEPNYVGIKVYAEIVPAEYSRPEVVQARVDERLRNLITPLALGASEQDQKDGLGADWEGWPFGRDLFVAEIYSMIQSVPGVKHVLEVQLSQRPVIPRREESQESESVETTLTPVTRRMVQVPANTLLCSLDHEIQVVAL